MSCKKLDIFKKKLNEIKRDFINNMTHEFKTPIATINLALDAIRNPKIIDDKRGWFMRYYSIDVFKKNISDFDSNWVQMNHSFTKKGLPGIRQ